MQLDGKLDEEVYLTVTPFGGLLQAAPNYGAEYTEAFERAYGELAKRHKVALLPFLLEGFAENQEYFQADRIHPTAGAQPLIAERVWKALRPLLK